ncbi:MAG: hypothetical protein QNJ97_24565 [Myxococcota bacterium]|nr:hypothetical protein [Myxococcota bacterium]
MALLVLTASIAYQPSPTSSGIDLALWKWVIAIGVGAVVIFYLIKRVSDIVVKKKTDAMIRSVEKDTENDPRST